MPENKFEKSVQDQLSSFRLQPAEGVWPEIEKRIREKKRRRILFFWLLFGALLLGGAGWWMRGKKDGKADAPAVAGNKPGNGVGTKELARNSQEPVAAGREGDLKKPGLDSVVNGAVPGGNEIAKGTGAPVPADKRLAVSITPPARPAPVVSEKATKRKEHSFPIRKADHPNPAQPLTKNIVPATITPGPVDDADASARHTNPVPLKNDSAVSSLLKAAPVSGITAPATEVTPVAKKQPGAGTDSSRSADTAVAAPVSNLPAKNPKKSKWEWSLEGGFGPARLTDKHFSLFSAKSAMDLSSGLGSGNPALGYADSIPLSGRAWNIGLQVRRKTGRRLSLSAGISLTGYRLKQRVGAYQSGAFSLPMGATAQVINGYYRPGSLSYYPNRYYFLQAPLLLHWQVNRGERLPPLVWENGIVPSWLAGSRALVFSTGSQVFYRDRSLYARFGMVYRTGFTMRLSQTKKHPLEAGLYYNFHLGKLQSQRPPDFNYLRSGGIRLRWTFRR